MPAAIFALKSSIESCVCSTSLPNSEFFLSPFLSSIIIAETPIRSRVLTLYTKCSVSPPVSPSRIIGLVVTSIISSIVRRRDDISTSSISGFPLAVLSHSELTHIASNWSSLPFSSTTVFSAIRPVRPLCASIVLTTGHIFISCFKRFLLYSGIASFSFNVESIFLTFSLYVYGTSISSPPYSDKSESTFSRITDSAPSLQLSP